MKHTGLYCLKCKTVVFSRATHDFRRCTCGDVFVDGGFDYIRIGYKKNTYKMVTVDLPKKMTKKALYDDWNFSKDSIGLYTEGEYPSFVKKAISQLE